MGLARMRVLGIDPGTIRMGMGLIEGSGNRFELVACESVVVSEKLLLPERLKILYHAVFDYIGKHLPEVMALENVFFGKNVSTLVKIGEARATAMLAASQKTIPVTEYPPARVKQAVTGNGQASKIQVQHMIRHLLRLKAAPPPDAADALAVALCHVQSQRFKLSRVRIPVG